MINAVFSDDRFERIRFYFQEQGFTALEDLADFNFDELMFVPGVSEKDVLYAKDIFSNANDAPPFPVNQNDVSPVLNLISDVDDKVMIRQQNESEYVLDSSKQGRQDTLITEVFSGVPRSAPFIQRCLANGKRVMSQLTDEDFDEAARLKGIGASSAENLRKIYNNNCNFPINLMGSSDKDLFNESQDEAAELSLSTRAINRLKRAGIFSLDELMSLTERDLLSIKNMGTKTCREILDYRESILLSSSTPEKYYRLENIDDANKTIPITVLRNIGVSRRGIGSLLNTGYITVGDLCNNPMSFREYSFVRPALKYLSVSAVNHFVSDIADLRDTAKTCIVGRCSGATLQEIGDDLGITRERVRQIIIKTCCELKKSADLVAGMLFSLLDGTFTFLELQKLFDNEQAALCCRFVLQESDYAVYFKFSDRFVCKNICPSDAEQVFKDFVNETIGEGINYYDNLELIEAELEKHSLSFFNFEDVMNYLVLNGYHFYGDYVTKGIKSYAYVCHDAVRKFFSFDIKLDSDENNEDMSRLRQIINKHYQGLPIPASNRSLTAAITRDASKMILSGRGRYCPIEKVIYNAALFDEVRNFVKNSSQTSFYYHELYTCFEGRFLAETNINNSNFLHGMLKCQFPDEFTYERDLFVKNNSQRQDVNYRLLQLLKQYGRAMTKSEIKKDIPGINDFVIAFSVMRMPKVIQWDYNEFNYIGNITAHSDDVITLRNIIRSQTEIHSGYCSEALLYNSALEKCSDFLKRNHINNSQNLYYTANYFFGEDYRFRRPHIVAKDFPIQELSIVNIAYALLKCKESLNYNEYCNLTEQLGWARGTSYAVFTELEKNYMRISENDYIHKDYFEISNTVIGSLSRHLAKLINNSNYYAFSSIFNYNGFPKYEYQWNGFLLESIITEYETGFRIIYPQVRDRRYQKGIIVPHDSPFNAFEDLVITVLKDNNIFSITEIGLETFLRMHGIITKVLPQEIYEWPQITYKNELFTIKR